MRLEETKIRFDAGNQLALLDAMRLCGKLGCPPPDWLVSASEAMLRERLLRKASDAAPGRNNSRWGQTYEWLKILRRAHTLNNVLLWLRDDPQTSLREKLTQWHMTEEELQSRPALRAMCGNPARRTITYAVDVAFNMLVNTWAHGSRRLIRDDHIRFLPPKGGMERLSRQDQAEVNFWRHEWSALLPETKELFGLNSFRADIKEL
ncbi:hypothetical protein [Neotabrizicola sp. VNH66]|uniref:hypothetical protein n=1 Tax=Neotabrizicola sp. VNH66 TaxID=3400918 RepID=UPI003BFEDF25